MVELRLSFVKFSRVFGDLCTTETVPQAMPLPAGNRSFFLSRPEEIVMRQSRMDLTTSPIPGA
jgi:hypothetical protein